MKAMLVSDKLIVMLDHVEFGREGLPGLCIRSSMEFEWHVSTRVAWDTDFLKIESIARGREGVNCGILS